MLAVGQALLRRTCIGRKYQQWRIGKCQFWGPPDFVALCRGALDQLSLLDPVLYQSLPDEDLTLWYEPKGPAVFYGHFGITDAFVAWQEKGVLACVVFVHFEAKLAGGKPLWRAFLADPSSARQKIDAAVRNWMAEHSFPAELANCFGQNAVSQ